MILLKVWYCEKCDIKENISGKNDINKTMIFRGDIVKSVISIITSKRNTLYKENYGIKFNNNL